MGESDESRGQWSSWLEFLMSMIGCMVGLGNIWRFPYLCYSNGGGAFLIPFFLFLLICAVPLVFLEMSYSQFASLGPGRVWRISPLFEGIGVGMITLTGIVSIYYNVIIAWAVYYLFMSFTTVLPWSTCNNEWNTPACAIRVNMANASIVDDNATNDVIYRPSRGEKAHALISSVNVTGLLNETSVNVTNKSPTEEFWERHVLEITSGVEEIGTVRWPLLICLFVAWLCVLLCLVKGIKSFGKVAYVTSTLPYVFLLILLVRGATLPGAIDGVKFYLIPRWEKLLSIKVWGDAAVQTFYSMGLGWGGIATLASYNKFHNNCYRDAMFLPLIDGLTSWFAGFVIFVILGFMSHQAQVPIEDVVSQGPGIAFVVYPEALAQLPIAPMWSVFFFLMLLMVGMDSQFVHVETIVSAVVDRFPKLRSKKTLVTAAFCLVCFILGIPCITQGGIYILQVVDWYCASVSVMILALLEVVTVAYIYGVDRLYADIEIMIGYKPAGMWKIFWLIITPATVLFIWLFSLVVHTPVEYGDYGYPDWALALGWLIGLCSLVPIPVCMAAQLLAVKGSIWQRIRACSQPSPNWEPEAAENKELYNESLRVYHGNCVGCFDLCAKKELSNTDQKVLESMLN